MAPASLLDNPLESVMAEAMESSSPTEVEGLWAGQEHTMDNYEEFGNPSE